MLLVHKRGATSFQELRTVDNVIHETFRSACLAMKLLVDDEIWIDCLNEASSQYSVNMIRDLFITIVSKCESAKPQDLFEKYSEFMIDDFTRHWKLRVENGSCTKHEANQYARNDLLCCLDSEFSKLNKENSDFDLPCADYGMKNTTLEENQIERERDPDYSRRISQHN